MKKFHIEYTLFGDTKERDWEAETEREAINGLILDEIAWSRFFGCPTPREAVGILKVNGVEVDWPEESEEW